MRALTIGGVGTALETLRILVHHHNMGGGPKLTVIGEASLGEDYKPLPEAAPSRSKRPTLEQYRLAARRIYHEEGSVEVDDRAVVSERAPGGDAGRYVQAWVWVSDMEARLL
jgi:hypothetical protein